MRLATITSFVLASLFLAACEQGASEVQQTAVPDDTLEDESAGTDAGVGEGATPSEVE